MRWFRHDSAAHRDSKIKRVKNKYGIVGYGLYWYCLELIAEKVEKSNVSFELEDDAELIAEEWKLDRVTVSEMMQFMVSIDLFESDNNRITCLKMAHRLDDTSSRNPHIKGLLEQMEANELRKSSEILGDPRNSSARIDKTRGEEIRKEENITDSETPNSLPAVQVKPKKAKATTTTFNPPLEITFEDWADYEEHRKKIRKQMTDRARRDVCANVIRCAVHNGISTSDVIGHAIQAGWTGIGADWKIAGRGKKAASSTRPDNSALAAKMAAEMEAEMAR